MGHECGGVCEVLAVSFANRAMGDSFFVARDPREYAPVKREIPA